MIFPDDFPESSKSAVIAVRIRVAAQTENELSYLPRSPSSTKQLASLGRSYILRIFAAFAKEACELGKTEPETWSASRIDFEALLFMRRLAIDVRSEYSHAGIPEMVGSMGYIDPGVFRELKLSDEWRAYQDALLEVAELRATSPAAQQKESIQKPHAETKTFAEPGFPRRAVWTRARLRERGWDHNDPQRHSGPDRKTMLKILTGLAVKEETIDKLVTSLNKQKIDGVTIKLLEVPND